MNLSDTLLALLRRWYVLLPGLVLAAAAAFGAWAVVSPSYERTATQVLLPGTGSVPNGDNPYLYMSGLGQAADVVVRALGSENIIDSVTDKYPGTTVDVSRDPTTSGPVIMIDITARSDSAAAGALHSMISQTGAVLADIQSKENVPAKFRISVAPLTTDDRSTLKQKTRMMAAGGGGIGVLAITLMAAALLEGLSQRRRRRDTVDRMPRRGSRAVLRMYSSEDNITAPIQERL